MEVHKTGMLIFVLLSTFRFPKSSSLAQNSKLTASDYSLPIHERVFMICTMKIAVTMIPVHACM